MFLMDLGALYILWFGCHPALYPLANLHPPSWIGLSTCIVSRMGVEETRLQLNSSDRYRRVSKLSRTDLSLKPSSTQTKDSLKSRNLPPSPRERKVLRLGVLLNQNISPGGYSILSPCPPQLRRVWSPAKPQSITNSHY